MSSKLASKLKMDRANTRRRELAAKQRALLEKIQWNAAQRMGAKSSDGIGAAASMAAIEMAPVGVMGELQRLHEIIDTTEKSFNELREHLQPLLRGPVGLDNAKGGTAKAQTDEPMALEVLRNAQSRLNALIDDLMTLRKRTAA